MNKKELKTYLKTRFWWYTNGKPLLIMQPSIKNKEAKTIYKDKRRMQRNAHFLSLICNKSIKYVPTDLSRPYLSYLPIYAWDVISGEFSYNEHKLHVWDMGLDFTPQASYNTSNTNLVHGPYTRYMLWQEKNILTPPIFGHPLLLLSRYYRPQSKKGFRVGIVVTRKTEETKAILVFLEKHTDCCIIDLNHYDKWTEVADMICGCERIVSSSVYGLMLADSYAIPNLWIDFASESSHKTDNKIVLDYVLSVGRTDEVPFHIDHAEQIEDAVLHARFRCAPDIPYEEIRRACPWKAHLKPFVYDAIQPQRQWVMAPHKEKDKRTAQLTIITPVRNGAVYLKECAKSLQCQRFKDWEWIIIDGHSVDETPQILKQLAETDSRIRPIFTRHRGVSFSRNVGLEQVRTPYVTFMDADDLYYNEDCLYNCMTLLKGHTSQTILKMSSNLFEKKESTRYFHFHQEGQYNCNKHPEELFMNCTWMVWDTIFTVDLLVYLRFQPLALLEDMIFIAAVFGKVKHCITTQTSVYMWRKHSASSTATVFTPLNFAENMQARYYALNIARARSENKRIVNHIQKQIDNKMQQATGFAQKYPDAWQEIVREYERGTGRKFKMKRNG